MSSHLQFTIKKRCSTNIWSKEKDSCLKLEAWRTQKIDDSQEAKFSFKVHLNISAKFGFLEFSTSADFYEKEICELVLNKNWLLN